MRNNYRGKTHASLIVACTAGVLAIAASSALAATAEEKQICPPASTAGMAMEEKRADLRQVVLPAQHSAILIGVDALGRLAVAADFDRNGTSDRIIMYTAQERLQGPWSRYLADAVISLEKGSLLVTSKSEGFGLSAAVSVARPQALPSWIKEPVVHEAGRELVQLFGADDAIAMASLDYEEIGSWPESLSMDLLAEQPFVALGGCTRECCDDGPCNSGGPPSTSCNIGGCAGAPSSCVVSGCGGTQPNNFACCGCGLNGQGGPAKCRCKACTCGSCP
jgi:hypothetical protein